MPDSYYIDGKTRGKASKDMGIGSQKADEKIAFVKKVEASDTQTEFYDDPEEFEINIPQKKPSLNEIPSLVRKSKESQIPEFLYGFNSSRKR